MKSDSTEMPIIESHLTEVAAGVGFVPQDCWNSVAPGLVYHQIRNEFPKVSDNPVLPPLIVPGQSIHVQDLVPKRTALPRTWFLSDDEALLLQLQDNRAHLNWRKRKEGVAYPTYQVMVDRFLSTFAKIAPFYQVNGEALQITSAELLYVNQFPLGEQSSEMTQIANMLSFVDISIDDSTKIRPVQMKVNLGDISTPNGDDCSRSVLQLEVKIADQKRDGNQLMTVTISCTGEVNPGSESDLRSWFSTAHDHCIGIYGKFLKGNEH